MHDIIYNNLPSDLKNQILKNNLNNKNLRLGFYSEVYHIKINDQNYSYRFHSILDSTNKKINTVIFNGHKKSHSVFVKNSDIFFYDEELKKTMKINKNLFYDEIVNMQLSDEQKEQLAEGKDISVDVNCQLKNPKKILSNSTFKKTFVADYSFFLGKNTLLLKNTTKIKNGLKLINN